jgi:hypothetical protein
VLKPVFCLSSETVRRQPRGLTPIRKGRAALASINPAMAQLLDPTLSRQDGCWAVFENTDRARWGDVDVGKMSGTTVYCASWAIRCFLLLGHLAVLCCSYYYYHYCETCRPHTLIQPLLSY